MSHVLTNPDRYIYIYREREGERGRERGREREREGEGERERGYYTVARRYELYFRVAKQYFTNKRSE